MSKGGRILPLIAMVFSAAFAGIVFGRSQQRPDRRRDRPPTPPASVSPELWSEDLDFGPDALLRSRPEPSESRRPS